MSISSILNIAKNAMSANQMAVQVTSNNISNVNTAGYAREAALFDEESPSLIGNALLGNGVKVSSVIRYYDKYLDQQISKKNTELEEQKVSQNYFGRIESILNEDSSKLTQNITDFFNAWQELSTDPQNVATREGVVASGQSLSRSIRNIYNGLKELQIELNDNVKKEVADINTITASIASLNDSIFQGSSGSSEANQFLDKRTALIKELAGKMDITSVEDQYGRATILTPGGKVLVDGGRSWDLVAVDDEETGFYNVGWKDSSGNISDITKGIDGGSIRGYIDMRDNQVGDFIDQLDGLAQGMISQVNAVHKNGYTLNHVATTPDQPDNITFFKELSGNYAKDIDLSAAVKADLGNVAAASEADSATGEPMGNDVAISIASLIDSKIFDNGTSTIVDYTSAMTNRIGQLSKGAQDSTQYSQDTMQLMEKQRESVSGVSLDEEMSDLIKFQYAFQASSRLFTVADQLFQSILEAVR